MTITCKHEWQILNNMTEHRENDGTYYSMAGHKWCKKCGCILKTKRHGPYDDTTLTVLEPNKEK